MNASRATFTVVRQTVGIQLQDANRANVVQKTAAHCYLTRSAAGPIVDAAHDAFTAGSRGQATPLGRAVLLVVTDEKGAVDLACVEPIDGPFFLNLILPDGSVATSNELSFTE